MTHSGSQSYEVGAPPVYACPLHTSYEELYFFQKSVVCLIIIFKIRREAGSFPQCEDCQFGATC